MGSIQLEGVAVEFPGGTTVFEDLDLEVRDGELLVVAGPSGSGKTTLLRVIAGLQTPTEGKVLIDGVDLTRTDTRARNLSMVFQDYALYAHMTAGRNIEFPLVSRRLKPEAERKRRVAEEARAFQIGHLLERMPGELSAGHRQAVATARAMVRTSEALLMDEPLAHLDPGARHHARLEVKRLHADVETTIVYVTNDQTEALGIGDRVAVLAEGRIQQVGAPMELYRRPVNEMVAGFIGTPSMRFVAAEVVVGGSQVHALVGTDEIDLGPAAERPELGSWAGLPVTLGIRPGDVTIAREGTAFERCLHGRVTDLVDHGSDVYATVDLGRGDSIIVARLRPGDPHRPGAHIELTVDPARVCVFDPASGDAISPAPLTTR